MTGDGGCAAISNKEPRRKVTEMKKIIHSRHTWAAAVTLVSVFLLVPLRGMAMEALSDIRLINTRCPSWDVSSVNVLDTTKIGSVIIFR